MFIHFVESAKEEVLLILPTTNAFLREQSIGIIHLLKKGAVERKVNVRILTPTNDVIEKVIQNMALDSTNGFFKIQPIETTSSSEITVNTITILVVDRKDPYQ